MKIFERASLFLQVSPYVFNFWAGGAVALSGVVASCFIPAGQVRFFYVWVVGRECAFAFSNMRSLRPVKTRGWCRAMAVLIHDQDNSPFHLSSPPSAMHPMQTDISMQIITPIGLISGALFVVAVGSSFVAISLLGSVATATGIWCGVAMCTSYFSGILTGENLNQYLSTLALLIMMCSVYRLSKTTQLSGCASFKLARMPRTPYSSNQPLPLLAPTLSLI